MEFAGVVFECPLRKENKECPFRTFHKMESNVQRYRGWQTLSMEAQGMYKEYHLKCKNTMV